MIVAAPEGWVEFEQGRGAFANTAHELRENGLCPIPVGGDGDKVPLVNSWTSWQRAPSFKTLTKWIEQYPDANIGIACGLSGVTIIDIDDPSIVTDMIQRFGDTPLITSTPSGGVHLWFKSSGERNANLRSHGLDVDVRGVGGMAVVPPSVRRSGEHAGNPYRIIEGCWDDLAQLPRLRTGSLVLNTGLVSPPSKGRNDVLFRYLLGQVRHCDDFDTLLDIAHTRNAEFTDPLPEWEVEKTARSAYDYEINPEKENWVGGPPRVVVTAGEGGEPARASRPGGRTSRQTPRHVPRPS
jgi:Bifunctional DNA primase/polymerase, N-terminal/Primase C terminal 1 (PriCT-1)